ncbi:Telomerase reverse transcriptase [Anthophora plagiata]
MDNCTMQSLKECFGTDFQQYCLQHNLLLKKDKSGAFILPNANALSETTHVIDKFKFQANKRLKTLQKKDRNYSQKLYKQHDHKVQKRRKSNTKATQHNSFLTNLQVEIDLHDTSPVLSSFADRTVPVNYILNTAKSGNEIYEYIIKETMKDILIIDYEASIPSISLILEQFQKRHKKFHYFSVLKNLICKQEPKKKSKYECTVAKEQLKSFFDLITAKVVPLSMFGKLKNLKKIKKTMFQLLNTPRFKFFNLMPLVKKIDISSITWLKDIGNMKIKWLIVTKFVKWFFVGFLLKILYSYFHVTSVSTRNNERLYILRTNWNSIQTKFIRRKVRSNTLQPDVKDDKWNPPIGTYKLYPKYSSVRPIFMSQCPTTDKQHLSVVFKFLKQLCITNYGLTNFEEEWKSIVQLKRNLKTEQLHVVSCDVVDAFGSIIQEKLYDIVQLLCQNLPEDLVLRYYVIRSKIVEGDICYRQYFNNSNLQLPFAPGTLYAYTNSNNCKWIKKSWLLEKIRKYIFYQRVRIRDTVYIIGKGIAQGTMLSPILSDIYYNFILHKEMTTFLTTGKIVKYMDDILYVTESETFAKQFLQIIQEGFPKYNCYFKKLKTQSNVAYDGNRVRNSIVYIGYKINCTTLEVEPEYSNTHLRYLISLSAKGDLTPLQVFKARLNHAASLKISKIILNNTVNSKRTIMKILKGLCLRQAKRACVLIELLFENVQKHIQKIFMIIKNNNERFARYIIHIFLKFKENMGESTIRTWNKRILNMLWLSYRNVFMKNKHLRQHFNFKK